MCKRNRIITDRNDPRAHQEVTETVLKVLDIVCHSEITPRRGGLLDHPTEEEKLYIIERAEHIATECVLDHLRKTVKCEVHRMDNQVVAKIHLPLILSNELNRLKKENEDMRTITQIDTRRINRLIKRAGDMRIQLEYEKLPLYKKWWKSINEPFDVE